MGTETWNLERLNQLRQVMDSDADSAVASIYGSQSSALLRNTLMQIATNDSVALKEYFSESDTPEPLYDLINNELSREFSDDEIAIFNRTHEIWQDHGIRFIYILFFRALPFTYAAEKPANVLRLTRLIEEQAVRRIFETAQFVFDVMDGNWWEPDKRGIITALKIRIMHAAMRHMLLNNEAGEQWAAAQWGMPISQEDVIATNQVFSLEFFKGMEMLGTPLSDEDQDAWFYTWKVIGDIMGIENDLLMPTIPEAWELQTAIYNHLFNDDHTSGVGLAKALVGALHEFLLPEKLTLIIMRKMMKDDAFPDVFDELLGPSFKDTYASLFNKENTADGKSPDQQVTDEFFEELKTFHDSVKAYRAKELENIADNAATAEQNIVDYQLDEFDKIFGDVEKVSLPNPIEEDLEIAEKKIFSVIDKIFDDADKSAELQNTVEDAEKIKEDIVRRAMEAISKVVIDVLSKYFRAGKNAGFRIDADLKEHWAIR